MSNSKWSSLSVGGVLLGAMIVVAGAFVGMRAGEQFTSYNPMAVDPTCDMSLEALNSADLNAVAGLQVGSQKVTTELASFGFGMGRPVAQEDGQRERGQSAAAPPETKVKPDLFIKDPYAAFSAVYVDNAHDEVVLADENNFNIMFFNRLENAPAKAEMSKPKRSLGGDNTDIEYQSALYVDPVNGDVYATNNDTKEKLSVFSRDQSGDVFAARQIATPYGGFGLAVDEQHQELMLTIQHAASVVTFSKSAAGHVAPLRIIQGNDTHLGDPHGIALDSKTDELFVSNWGSTHKIDPSLQNARSRRPDYPTWPYGVWVEGKNFMVPGSGSFQPPSITVYARTASGDTVPLRVISGPKTQLDWPTNISLDSDRGELYVANDMADSVLVFKTTQEGDVAPIRVLKGPKSLIKHPTGVFADVKHGELWVANYGDHTATVYKLTASGDATPIRVIRSAPKGAGVPEISNSNSLGFDSKREEIIAPSCVHHPEIAMFDSMATGGVSPLREIAGTPTHLARTVHGVAYDAIHDEIFVGHNIAQAVMVFRGAANGEEAPIRVIQGPHTRLIAPELIAEDPVNNEIYVPEANHILVFPRDGNGDIAPIRVLEGPDTLLGGGDVDIDPIHNVLVVGGGLHMRVYPEKGEIFATGNGRILIFDRTAQGNTKPIRIINGRTGAVGGNAPHSLPPGAPSWYWNSPINQAPSNQTYVGVWSIYDNGIVPPHFRIGGPDGVLRMIHGVAIDPQHKSVLISDKLVNGLLTYYVPDAF